MNKQEAISILKEHNQEHVIKRLEALEDDAAKKLISQVAMIDWKVVESINDKSDSSSEDKKIEPLEAVEIKDIKANKEKYTAKGVEAIKNGKVAAVLLAGGQGTRLGLDKPKGTLNVGVNKDLFLFGQLIRNLLDVVDMTGAYVPLYIMTSDKNNEDTVAFFEEHNYFGYDKDYVKFFIQSMVPSVDYNGKLYMESTDSLAMSPNGNGGWFLSLMAAGVPIKRPVAGISTGLVTNPNDENDYVMLTDIQGLEDFFGDMDFKVGGTEKGITAIQVDIKIDGLTYDIIKEAFEKEKEKQLCIDLKCLLLVGIATSIDAFSAGISLSLFGNRILKPAILIGVVTFINSLLGFGLGGKLKKFPTKWLEITAGCLLILLGLKSLF